MEDQTRIAIKKPKNHISPITIYFMNQQGLKYF